MVLETDNAERERIENMSRAIKNFVLFTAAIPSSAKPKWKAKSRPQVFAAAFV